jgi:hypothetical protein
MGRRKGFSFTTAKDALQSVDPISVTDLARELETTENKVLLLLEEGYLTLLKESATPFLCLVGRPAPAAMQWLKQALSPLPLVPIIPVSYAMEMLRVGSKGMKRLLLEHGIQVYIDVAMGPMMTIMAFHQMFSLIYPWHERIRFDRQMFFSILAGIDLGGGEKFIRPIPFDVMLEEELARIGKLPEPQRALRAMDVYQAYLDAKSITSVIRKLNKTPTQTRVDQIMGKWRRNRKRHYSLPSPSSSSSVISSATSSASRSTRNPPSAAD